jgi:acyl-CoA thioester hydrolase
MSTPFTLPITATPADIDELGHVNNAVWVRWIQDVSTAHWLSLATPEQNQAYRAW